MTTEEYFRKMASLLMQIKALADNYEEGCETLYIYINDGLIFVGNDSSDGDNYAFSFRAGKDFENGKIERMKFDHWNDYRIVDEE